MQGTSNFFKIILTNQNKRNMICLLVEEQIYFSTGYSSQVSKTSKISHREEE